MNQQTVRKYVTVIDRVERDGPRQLDRPITRCIAAAVIVNPFSGRYAEDLTELVDIGAELGGLLGQAAVDAMGGDPTVVEGYGKAALVGADGELEHAAALLHPRLGAGLRDAIGGGKALVPSAKAIGGLGAPLLIPLGHKDAAYVRSHFDAIELAIADSPRRDEIVIAIALADGGRPSPRVGGLTLDEVVGEDGLR